MGMSVTTSGPPTQRGEVPRPLGITLLALFFVIAGIGVIFVGFMFIGDISPADFDVHVAIEWLIFILPFVIIGWGILGVLAGVWLWQGKPIGVTAGIVVLVLTLFGEFLLHATIIIGELTYGDMGLGGLSDVVRILITVGLLVYLWRLDSDFIKDNQIFEIYE